MAEQIGTCDLRLQQHFSFIKGIRIPLQKMNSIAFQSIAFNQEEFDYTLRQPDNVHQKETFLKTLIRKGHNSCKQFLSELARSGYDEQVKICLSDHNDDDNVNDQLNNVTPEKIEENLEYIASNLEIGIVLDMLFERQIITIDEHDEIQRKSTKPEKRRTLLSLLLGRPNTNWLSGFIRVLTNTGHIILLKRLRQHVSNGQELEELLYVRLGDTIPVPCNFIVRLSTPTEEREVINLHTEPVLVEQVIQEALDSGVIEIWLGSIYFYLSTFSPDTILTILNGKGDAKLITFLQLLFSRNKYLLLQFPKDTIVQFELEEKPEDIFIDTFYGRWKSQIPTNTDEFCSGCYQATLRTNYKTVLDEIEYDIIQDTLTRLEKLEKPNDQLHSSQCLLKNKTRSENAFTFLQYVLGNEHVLYEFSKAFEYHSQVELKRVKCRNCSSPEGVLIPSKPRKIVFHFTISMNDLDQIKITIEKELMTPSVALRPLVGIIDKATRLFHYIINMGQTQSERTDNFSEQDAENDINILRRLATNGGPIAVSAYIDNGLNRWQKEQVKFGITGRYGTGKFTFINRVRNVQKDDDDFAREIFIGMTEQITLYLHPKNHQIAFYDLAGHSSMRCKKEDYISKMNISDYDFVFIFIDHCLSEDDIWLSGELCKLGKPFCLVQSNIDSDIDVAVHNKIDAKMMIKKIREHHEREFNSNPELKGIKRIFLISSRNPDLADWSDLMAYIEDNMDGVKAQAFLFSLDSFTKEMLERKYKMLTKRIIATTVLAASVAAIPVPGVDAYINIGILVHEVRHYLTVFGVEAKRVNALKDFDHSLLKCRSLLKLNVDMTIFVGTKMASYTALLLAQSFTDLIFPLVGSVISSTTAARLAYKFLNDMLQDIKDDAELIYEHIVQTNADHRM